MRLGGRWQGQQVIPANAIADIRRGADRAQFVSGGYSTLPGWSYRSQWWIAHDDHGAYAARGVHGQALYIDPKAEMVIARFGSHPLAGNVSLDPTTLPAFRALAEHLQQPGTLDLRVNTFQAKRSEIQKELAQAGIAAELTPYSPWGLRLQGKPALQKTDAFTRGAIEVQDEGSQLLALLVDAHRGEMVVDFCAGAGGKTLALGAAMRSTGRLYAFDVSGHRLDALKPRMARSGLSNVHPAAIAHERDDRVKRLAGKIDRVLVDAPCSGLGTLRRNPDLKWRQKPQGVQELTEKQQAILQSASRMVKSGGRLVYATCSMLPEENELIAQAFSAANPDFVPLNVAQELDRLKVPHAASLCSPAPSGDAHPDAPPAGTFLRLWPHRHATDGFFAAAWVKK